MVIGCKVFHTLKKIIKAKFEGVTTLIGDEVSPPCDMKSILDVIIEVANTTIYFRKSLVL